MRDQLVLLGILFLERHEDSDSFDEVFKEGKKRKSHN